MTKKTRTNYWNTCNEDYMYNMLEGTNYKYTKKKDIL